MSTLLNKSYLDSKSVYEGPKGGGSQKGPKFCLRGLYTAPFNICKRIWFLSNICTIPLKTFVGVKSLRIQRILNDDKIFIGKTKFTHDGSLYAIRM